MLRRKSGIKPFITQALPKVSHIASLAERDQSVEGIGLSPPGFKSVRISDHGHKTLADICLLHIFHAPSQKPVSAVYLSKKARSKLIVLKLSSKGVYERLAPSMIPRKPLDPPFNLQATALNLV